MLTSYKAHLSEANKDLKTIMKILKISEEFVASITAFLVTFFIFWLLLMYSGLESELALAGAFIIAVLIGLIAGGSSKSEQTYLPRRDIENIAMDLAMRYERSEGREPVDVSSENRGFDIISKGRWGDIRYIEVKGMRLSGRITLTINEWKMARRLESGYWLYIVTNIENRPILYIIQNPSRRLRARRENNRYIIDEEEWLEEAEEIGSL